MRYASPFFQCPCVTACLIFQSHWISRNGYTCRNCLQDTVCCMYTPLFYPLLSPQVGHVTVWLVDTRTLRIKCVFNALASSGTTIHRKKNDSTHLIQRVGRSWTPQYTSRKVVFVVLQEQDSDTLWTKLRSKLSLLQRMREQVMYSPSFYFMPTVRTAVCSTCKAGYARVHSGIDDALRCAQCSGYLLHHLRIYFSTHQDW